MKNKNLEVIGTNTLVDIGEHHRVPAKIDTGADTSAIWASSIELTSKGVLRFALFDKKSPYYTGKLLERKEFKQVSVRSSNGHSETRFRVCIPIKINGRNIRATFTLADRSHNIFPVLIGRRTLKHKFLVDVSHNVIPEPSIETKPLREEVSSTESAKKPAPKTTKESTSTVAKTTVTKNVSSTTVNKPVVKHSSVPAKKPVSKSSIQKVLRKALAENNYKKIAPKQPRRLYFEKYKNSYALSNLLFHIFRLYKIKGIDLRADFVKVMPLIQLHRYANRILTDPKALLYLSSHAVNIICLNEILYPHHHDYTNKLARMALNIDPDAHPELYVELCTQIIIADSHYFTRSVSKRNKLLLRQLLRRAFMYFDSFSGHIPTNVKQKFLACAKLVGQESEYRQKMNRKTEKV